MKTTCKNCNTSFNGNFCFTCGQPAKTERLDVHSVWHDIQHGLLHIDKGILYTVKLLFTRPGQSIKAYLEGKRVKHFKPLSLVIILATIYALLNHYLHIELIEKSDNHLSIRSFGLGFQFEATQGENLPLAGIISDFIESHFALFQLIFLPFYSAATWLAFRKAGHNYIEHLVINAFLRGQALLIALGLLPFVYFKIFTPEISSGVFTISQIICFLWAFLQIYSGRKKSWVVLRSILAIVYLFVILLSVILIIILVINLFDMI